MFLALTLSFYQKIYISGLNFFHDDTFSDEGFMLKPKRFELIYIFICSNVLILL